MTETRLMAAGLLIGWIMTALVLLLFPIFFSALPELFYLPIAGAMVGVVAAALWWTFRRLLDRPAGTTSTRRLWSVVLVVMAVTLVGYGLRGFQRSWEVSPGVVMIGVDGAGWNMVGPLMAAGKLPALARLAEEGTVAPLESLDPSYSPIIWTTIATGLVPERHGIAGFYSTQKSLKAKRIWEIVNESGGTAGIFRWWASWPPRPVNGFLIPGILAHDAQTVPPEYGFVNQLRIDLKAGKKPGLGGYASTGMEFVQRGLRLRQGLDIFRELLAIRGSGDRVLRHVANRRAEIRLNFDLYGYMLREFEPDYTSIYDNGVDVLSHRYWKFQEPENFPQVSAEEVAAYGEVIADFYRLVDEVIGDLVQHLGEDTTVVVVSDHGLEGSDQGVGARWIPLSGPILDSLGMERDFFGINLANRIYVESVKTNAEERIEALETAVRTLEELVVEETGEPVFETKMKEDKTRFLLFMAPGVVPGDHHVKVGSATVLLTDWLSLNPGKSGIHQPEGILFVRGPGIRRGQKLQSASVLDVAPTVLHLLGQPVAEDLDGRVLVDAFTDEYRRDSPIRTVPTYGELSVEEEEIVLDDQTERALRALGYVN